MLCLPEKKKKVNVTHFLLNKPNKTLHLQTLSFISHSEDGLQATVCLPSFTESLKLHPVAQIHFNHRLYESRPFRTTHGGSLSLSVLLNFFV